MGYKQPVFVCILVLYPLDVHKLLNLTFSAVTNTLAHDGFASMQ